MILQLAMSWGDIEELVCVLSLKKSLVLAFFIFFAKLFVPDIVF